MHTFDIQLPKIAPEGGTHSFNCLSNPNKTLTQSCIDATIYYDTLNKLQANTYAQLRAGMRQIHSLLRTRQPLGTSVKNKRGWFDAIGNLGYHLFGLARKSDLDIIEERIKTVTGREENLLQDFEMQLTNLASASSITNQRVDKIRIGLAQHEEELKLLEQKLQTSQINSVQFSAFLAENILNFTSVLDQLVHIRTAAESLLNGRIHPGLLHRSHLKQAIDKIAHNLYNRHKGSRILVQDVEMFYRNSQFITTKTLTHLYITIFIPLSTLPTSFYLYQVTTYPKSITESHQAATHIVNLPNYLLISTDHKYSATSDRMFTLLPGDQFQLVNISDIILRQDSNECIIALFQNNDADIAQRCSFKLVSGKPSVMIPLPSHQIILENLFNLSITCDDTQSTSEMVKLANGCLTCVIQLPPTCTLNSPIGFVPAQIPQNDSEVPSHSTIAFSHNRIMLQFFFNENLWKMFRSDSVLNESLVMQLPMFNIADLNNTIATQQDIPETQAFSETMEAIKRGETLFQNDYNHLVSTNSPTSSDYTLNTISGYIQPITITISLLSFVFMLYLCRKVNKLTVSVMALTTRLPTAQAQKYWLFSTSTTVIPTTTPSIASINLYLLLILIVLTGFVVVYIVRKCYQSRQINFNHESLSLRFENPNNHIVIPWTSLLYPVSEIQFYALSALRMVRVYCSSLKFFLEFQWDFEIRHTASGVIIRPPSKINLSIRDYIKLREIINGYQGYRTTLWTTKDGCQHEILIDPTPDPRGDPPNQSPDNSDLAHRLPDRVVNL